MYRIRRRQHFFLPLLLLPLYTGCGDGSPVEPELEPGSFRAELTGRFEGDFAGDASLSFRTVAAEDEEFAAMTIGLQGQLPGGSGALMSVFFVVPSRFEVASPGSYPLESVYRPGDPLPEPGDLVAWLSQPSDTSEAFRVTHAAFAGQAELTESSSNAARGRFSLSFEPLVPDEADGFTAEGQFSAPR